ncbi:ParB/RepB/Spo0J family partition protein [Deinococcus reticulitermitis]|uniref:ParB/RepB/Spo0J family partition protein n=1 Tax=Deinococcus reticulitermitis TaxID=856736 RepID=A0A1H6SK26_9DEIO|nr:ParB/RepB/Spo0J family partition protein [Deinococcus reticulitermitis]SEI68161.1 ParB/RepB/Spo0J family partition protein [Deinococcus reticulitermitis]
MGLSPVLPPAVLAALRAATLSDDGLSLTLTGQLDADTYRRVKKALDTYGGKWNRKSGTHEFTKDFRPHFEHLLSGGKVGADNGGKNPLAFFPTPAPVIEEMCRRIWPWPNGSRFLEPSAGEGAIADFLWNRHSVYADCVELDEDRAQVIRRKGYPVVGSDFLQFTPEQPYDYVLMNPPFTVDGDTQVYIDHIKHALKCLRPGGDLLAVVPGSFAWLTRKRVAEFRAWCAEHAQSPLHEFAPGTFSASGTDIATCLIHLTRPEEADMPRTTKKTAPKPEAQPAQIDFKKLAEETRARMRGEKPAPTRRQGEVEPITLERGDPAEVRGPILADSALSHFTLAELVPSPLNPRKLFEQAPLEELAESILHKGLMQNLVGRVAGDGEVEVVAGGRRLRALKLLAEQGRIPADYPVPVRVQPLSDLEALQLATAENVERRNMTPLEEADAFAGMVALGATPQDIALRFGFSEKTVRQRLVLAEGLGEDGRELFVSGKIGLGQAQVIAQTSGPLRKHVLDRAKEGRSVGELQRTVQQGSFLVEHARFDVAASGLEIIEDLYGDAPARFADPKAALARQLDWANARAEALRGKKEHLFAEVKVEQESYLSLSSDEFRRYGAPQELLGTVLLVSSVTGQVKEERAARAGDIKSHEAKQQAKERAKASSEATGSEGAAIRKSGWEDGHIARATALRSALVGDHKRAVALTILTLLEAEPVTLRASLHHVQAVPIPAGLQRLRELDEKLGGGLGVGDAPQPKNPLTVRFSYGSSGERAARELLERLLTLSLEELLDFQSVLIAQAVGGWSPHNPVHAPYPFVVQLAADTGAKVEFRLTDAHLKAYPRDRLLELAADAGLEAVTQRAANLSTNKDLRAAILQHADELHARGYVPPIARFPAAEEGAEDRQYRADALALVPRLTGFQVGELLEDLGFDPTEDKRFGDEAAERQVLADELGRMDLGELREWDNLRRIARDLGPLAAALAHDLDDGDTPFPVSAD